MADGTDYAFYEHVSRETQRKQTVKSFLSLTESLFAACAQNFSTSALTNAERKCIENVSKKYIAHSLRVSARFAELDAAKDPSQR